MKPKIRNENQLEYLKKLLTEFDFGFIILSMSLLHSFLYYIPTLFKLASNFTQALKTAIAIKATAVLFFLQQKYRKSGVSLLGHYGPSFLM